MSERERERESESESQQWIRKLNIHFLSLLRNLQWSQKSYGRKYLPTVREPARYADLMTSLVVSLQGVLDSSPDSPAQKAKGSVQKGRTSLSPCSKSCKTNQIAEV